jgi:hypothetical protein
MKLASVVITTPSNAPPTPSRTPSKASAAASTPALGAISPGLNVIFAPKPRGQMGAMLAVDRAKTASILAKLEGDAVIEVGKDGKSLGKGDLLEKNALLERLVRLAATDVPGTPRLLMRQRSPEELAALQHGVQRFMGGFHEPAKQAVEPMLQRLPQGKVQHYLRKGVHALIENPEGLAAWGTGIPGALEGYVGGKKLLEKGIDRLAPLAAHNPTMLPPPPSFMKAGAGAPTRGGFLMASDVPPLTAPSLRAPVQKLGGGSPAETTKAAEVARIAVQEATAALHKVGEILTKVSDSLPDYVTYSPSDFKPANLNQKPKMADGAGEGMGMSPDTAANNQQPEDFKEKKGVSENWVAKTILKNPAQVTAGRLDAFHNNMRAGLDRAVAQGGSSNNPLAGKYHTAWNAASQRLSSGDNVVASATPQPGQPGFLSRLFGKQADVSPSVTWNPGTGGAARQASYVPPMKMQSLRAPVAKIAAAAPMGALASQPPPPIPAPTIAKTVGTPKIKAPGPSIADVAKPKGPGFGTGIAGAFKPQTGVGGTGPIDMNTKLGPGNSK